MTSLVMRPLKMAAAVAQAVLISAIWAIFSAIFSAAVTSLAIYSAAEEDVTATVRCAALM